MGNCCSDDDAHHAVVVHHTSAPVHHGPPVVVHHGPPAHHGPPGYDSGYGGPPPHHRGTPHRQHFPRRRKPDWSHSSWFSSYSEERYYLHPPVHRPMVASFELTVVLDLDGNERQGPDGRPMMARAGPDG